MSRAVRLMSLIAAISFWSAIGATARAEESDTAALAAALKTAKATLQASPDPSATLSPRFQPPPRRTQRADFPHCAPPFASRRGLLDLSCRGDFRSVAAHSIAVEQP